MEQVQVSPYVHQSNPVLRNSWILETGYALGKHEIANPVALDGRHMHEWMKS